ncbi:EAL domain-containing protein [Arcobacter cryaerophilus gv. pseudocryaerophilus]|uniref:EAL domain-containing protein n=3 Tax=Arcobacteraceae TaxID=2808963 RepID=A0AA96DTI7_9BACT|nr:EAL domain-containing protein [Aliarcobacter cryaerophilus]WNL34916.1 EAL domain-containing protein [Arcobacter sp. AZ-2023]WPD11320.1 EAL domain-containing protein [Arcobacter sp. DSM 115960]AYJ77521.1 diguanylate cyclase/phosphodiesterase [Aliarcobacter cryaerophilus D2610]MCT7518653.1 EAL domain-containing protein [Aliarcobacter cryaerophilus]WNL35604.1 EAL domain-containing protein [Arcobacter sp. AZ-2023]
MIFSIQRFILFFIALLFLLFSIMFFYYFKSQEEQTSKVIYTTLEHELAERAYSISKMMEKKDDILLFRSLLVNAVANNNFLKAILVFDDDKLLLTTDPKIKSVDKNLILSDIKTYNEKLSKITYLKDDIIFFEQNKQKSIDLIFLIDKEEINQYFIKNREEFFIYFGFLPIFGFFLFYIVFRKYITIPLEKLRQLAYYNNKIPKAFKIRELESIRHSMVDSFSRLENEKKEFFLMARTDSLSGLANRNSLQEFLDRLIPTAKRKKEEFAFLFLDLDHFKTINDSLGHNIGDELLQKISGILKKVLRPNDFIARVGGDEFVLIIQDYKSNLELTNIIKRVQKQLSKPWVIQTHPVETTCSIGIAIFPQDGKDQISLMKSADIAMYEAKKHGRNQYHFFTKELNDKLLKIINLNKQMRIALKNGDYQLFYQPKVCLKDSKIIGVEALIRWIDKEKGFIPPSDFIPLAEENDFIIDLGDWIVEEALNQYLDWKNKGIDIVMSINISAKQFLQNRFAENLIEKINSKKIEPNRIILELTEYILIDQNNSVYSTLRKLNEFGVSISLDDFGTGYSSLSYLKKYPIDYLKIDKSFIDDSCNSQGKVFIETIVKMGQTLNMKIVAEGVETQEQVEYLKSISCNLYQGYYFSKPIKAKELEEFYKSL